MPIAPPPEDLLIHQELNLMELFGRMRSLADRAGFKGTLPAIWQCSDETQSIKKSLFGYVFNCPSFNLGRVGSLLDPSRLATAAHHGHDLVIVGGSHIGAEEVDGIGYIRRIHDQVAPCCGMMQRLLSDYLQVYQRATKLIKICRRNDTIKVEVPYKYLFRKPAGETVRILIRLRELTDDASIGEGTLGKIYRLHPDLVKEIPEHFRSLDENFVPIGSLLTPKTFTFSKKIDHASHEPKNMLEVSLFDFMPDVVVSSHPHRRLCDVNTWRQFHRIASYVTDDFDSSDRNIFILAGLSVDHTIHHQTFIPQYGFWMEKGQALEARYYSPTEIHDLLKQQEVYRPPKSFLEYAGIE
ncbi:MAG: hypothetical protein C0615_03845 [Desulfuromonas sp.]|nr:MAG: hypothetical protein C0615_03845 [Desulfuromonas sp.]